MSLQPVAAPGSVFGTIQDRFFARNASVTVLWDATWAIGAGCCLIETVVPAYLLSLGASRTLVQTVMVGFAAATALQLLSTKLVHGPHRKIVTSGVWVVFSLFLLTYGVVASVGWEILPKGVWIPFFIFTCAGVAACRQLGTPVFAEIVLENIPLKKRGRLGSMRNLTYGVFGVAGVAMASWLMKQWPQPLNFHRCFIIGPGIMMLSCASFLLFCDNAQKAKGPSPARASAVTAGRTLLSDFNFRVFLVFFALLFAGQQLGPLLISYGKDLLAMPPDAVAQFTGAFFGGLILVGAGIPLMADRYGFRVIAAMSAGLLGTAYLLPIVFPASSHALLLAYALYAGGFSLNVLVLANLGSELVPHVKPGAIIAVGSVLVMPLSVCIAPLGGHLVDLHGQAGYLATFVMGITVSVCALVGFLVVVREPRTGQEIYIRIRR